MKSIATCICSVNAFYVMEPEFYIIQTLYAAVIEDSHRLSQNCRARESGTQPSIGWCWWCMALTTAVEFWELLAVDFVLDAWADWQPIQTAGSRGPGLKITADATFWKFCSDTVVICSKWASAELQWMMTRIVGGWMFLLVLANPGSPGQRAVKRLLLLLSQRHLWKDRVDCHLPFNAPVNFKVNFGCAF